MKHKKAAGRMASQLNSIKDSGMMLNMIWLNFSMLFTEESWSSRGLIMGLSLLYLKFLMLI